MSFELLQVGFNCMKITSSFCFSLYVIEKVMLLLYLFELHQHVQTCFSIPSINTINCIFVPIIKYLNIDLGGQI